MENVPQPCYYVEDNIKYSTQQGKNVEKISLEVKPEFTKLTIAKKPSAEP